MPTIAELNDAARRNPEADGVKMVFTRGVWALPDLTVIKIAGAVVRFDAFEPDDDPYGEHDFGAIEVDGHKVFWKIDYYDRHDQDYGSSDPADPERTLRVLTIMLAEEY